MQTCSTSKHCTAERIARPKDEAQIGVWLRYGSEGRPSTHSAVHGLLQVMLLVTSRRPGDNLWRNCEHVRLTNDNSPTTEAEKSEAFDKVCSLPAPLAAFVCDKQKMAWVPLHMRTVGCVDIRSLSHSLSFAFFHTYILCVIVCVYVCLGSKE